MDRRSLTFIAVLAASIILSCILITAQRSDGPPVNAKLEANRNDKGTKAENDKTNSPLVTTTVATTPVATNGAERTKPKPDPPKTKSERLTNWLWGFVSNQQTFSNLLLVAVGGAAFIIGLFTLFAIKREVGETAKAAKAAEDAATAAKDTLATNKEIERAYIAIGHKDIIWYDCTDLDSDRKTSTDPNADSLEVVMTFQNKGRTPCNVVGGWVGFVYEKPADGEHPDLSHVFGGDHLTPWFMLPNEAPIDMATGVQLGQENVTSLRTRIQTDRQKHFWLVCEVHYRDRFKIIHKVGYGRWWNRRSQMFQINPSTDRLNFDERMSAEDIRTREYHT